MQFFQTLLGVAAVAGCSANMIQWNSQKLHNPNKIIGLQQFDTGNKLIGLQQLDAGNKLIGLQQFDTGNKLIGLSQFDSGNKLIGLSQLDAGNKIIGLQSYATPSNLILTSQPAQMHIATGRGYGLANAGVSNFALGGVATDNSAFALNNGAANLGHVQLVSAAPAVSNFGARTIGLASHAAQPSLIMAGRSSDQVAISSASADVKPVTAAVATVSRTVDYTPMAYSGEPAKTQVVNVPPNEQGLHINFFSKSSPLTVSQQHIPGEAGQVHVTESVDEPQRLIHNVKKSVIQEVNESVQPFRILKQEVKPVIEQAHTVVAEGNNIPLSGRSSGIIATDQQSAAIHHHHQQQPSAAMAMLHRPTQVITAQEPVSVGRSLKIAAIQPEADFGALNVAIAQPRGFDMGNALGMQRVAIAAQPAGFTSGFGLQKFAVAQPAAYGSSFGLEKVAIAQPGLATGSIMLAGDANPSGWMSSGHKSMLVHQSQPSMIVQQKTFGMPLAHTSSAFNTRFINKPAAFTNIKMKQFKA